MASPKTGRLLNRHFQRAGKVLPFQDNVIVSVGQGKGIGTVMGIPGNGMDFLLFIPGQLCLPGGYGKRISYVQVPVSAMVEGCAAEKIFRSGKSVVAGLVGAGVRIFSRGFSTLEVFVVSEGLLAEI